MDKFTVAVRVEFDPITVDAADRTAAASMVGDLIREQLGTDPKNYAITGMSVTHTAGSSTWSSTVE